MSGEVVNSLSLHKASSIGFTWGTECMEHQAGQEGRSESGSKLTVNQSHSIWLGFTFHCMAVLDLESLRHGPLRTRASSIYEAMTIPSQSSPIVGRSCRRHSLQVSFSNNFFIGVRSIDISRDRSQNLSESFQLECFQSWDRCRGGISTISAFCFSTNNIFVSKLDQDSLETGFWIKTTR